MPGITRAELFTAIQEFPFTSTILRTTFNKYKNDRDEQSATDLKRFVQTPESEIQSSGYVVHMLEGALWAFFSTSNIQEGAQKVVSLGSDADTIDAVYGGLLGARYDIRAIPVSGLEGYGPRGMLDERAAGVVKLVKRGGYDEQRWKDTQRRTSNILPVSN